MGFSSVLAAAGLVLTASLQNDPALEHVHFGDEALQRARSPDTVMKLQMMTDKGLKGMGAVCLDGTDAGFYFAPASNPKNANDWQIYFEGGGWCYDEMDCWVRSNHSLGSSKSWPQTAGGGGIMSDDCEVNPDFCNFNRVHMRYCDGNSFSGNRDEPVVVTGLDGKPKPLYFRGRRILDATLETLLTLGLGKAERVLLTGCSAGGLATFLHTDYVHERLRAIAPAMKTFKSAPISGFFLLHNTVEGKPVYPTEMREIFHLANSTHGLNDRCIAAMGEEEKWKCNFAEMAYAYTESPIFPLNSALDSWQTICIYTAELAPGFPKQNDTTNGLCSAAPGYEACANNPEECDAAQMTMMNRYISDFDEIMQEAGTYGKAGNGAFIHSCHTHCEAQSESWNQFSINGVTMQQAFSKWWNSDSETASLHSYAPCLYKTATSPHRCNPTCASADDQVLVV